MNSANLTAHRTPTILVVHAKQSRKNRKRRILRQNIRKLSQPTQEVNVCENQVKYNVEFVGMQYFLIKYIPTFSYL